MDDEIHSKFFENVINGQYNDIREWLKHQSTHEIRTFMDFQQFRNEQDKYSLLQQELERRETNRQTREVWMDRMIGFVGGLVSGIIVTLLGLYLK